MFSAMVIHSISVMDDNAIVLFWFAGQNPFSDAHAMAIALLAQLLHNGEAVLQREQVQDIEGVYPNVNKALSEPIAVLTLLFRWIREQLKITTIYCVLDSVSCYEDYRKNELLEVYQMLQAIAKAWHGEHCLKILITSPTESTCIGTCDNPSHPTVLYVDQVVDGARAWMGAETILCQSAEPRLLPAFEAPMARLRGRVDDRQPRHELDVFWE
jgi:hypothetical protein